MTGPPAVGIFITGRRTTAQEGAGAMTSTKAEGATRTPSAGDGPTRILDAAWGLFLSDGFAAVTTDRLCRAAGVSKTTLYKHFGDMGGVLAAVVRREGDRFAAGVVPEAGTADAFHRALARYGANLLALLNQQPCVRLDRMLHEESRRHPDLARAFYDAAYGRSHRDLTAMIAHGRDRGFVAVPGDPADLADNLLSMWEGLAYVRARLGLTERPFADPAAWSRQCVETLFRATVREAAAEGSS
jgi:TetR/AcrR family transcriptional repressor of mexJK operon